MSKKMSEKVSDKTVEKNCGKEQKTVEKILYIINENPFVTQNQLIDLTGLSRRGVEWHLKQLKDKNIIRRVGGKKLGHWEIVQGEENE